MTGPAQEPGGDAGLLQDLSDGRVAGKSLASRRQPQAELPVTVSSIRVRDGLTTYPVAVK